MEKQLRILVVWRARKIEKSLWGYLKVCKQVKES